MESMVKICLCQYCDFQSGFKDWISVLTPANSFCSPKTWAHTYLSSCLSQAILRRTSVFGNILKFSVFNLSGQLQGIQVVGKDQIWSHLVFVQAFELYPFQVALLFWWLS